MTIGVGHAGDVSPEQAMVILQDDSSAVLVDVRTTAEWENVGVPDLSSIGKQPLLIEWAVAPAMARNPRFAEDLTAELQRRGAGPDTPLLFLCRSGARSGAAAQAMTERGFLKSYNVAGGFEGAPAQGLPGWRKAGHPWTF